MRQFSFNLVIVKLPNGEVKHLKCSDVIKGIEKNAKVLKSEDERSFEVVLNNSISFLLSNSFHSDLNLGVPYVGVGSNHHLVNIPLWAIKIQVKVSDKIGQYKPSDYRDLIVKFIGDNSLQVLPENEWWYLIATTPQAFIFLQDIVEPKVISVSNAECYVKTKNSSLTIEKRWVFLNESNYKRNNKNGDNELHWFHKPTGVGVILIFEQRPHPIVAYENQIRQLHLVKKLSDYNFRAIQNASNEIIERIRRIVDPQWIIMRSSNGDLFWAFPKAENDKKIQKVDKVIQRLGTPVLKVADENKKEIIKVIENSPSKQLWFYTSSEVDLVTPILLDKRILLLKKRIKSTTPKKLNIWIKLVQFKANYESKYGFNFMREKTETLMASEEIKGFLFDLQSFRGKRMLDIMFYKNKLLVSLRIRESSIKSTDSLISSYIDEINEIIDNVLSLLES